MKDAGNGLTGWLSPKGIFSECQYGEHNLLAKKLVGSTSDSPQDALWEKAYINLTSSPQGDSTVGWNYENEPTKEQKQWFLENIDNLDEAQVNEWNECKKHWSF